MGQFDFTYELPSNFSSVVIQFLRQEHRNDMMQAFQQCKFEYDDKGLAYYAGMTEIIGIKGHWILPLKDLKKILGFLQEKKQY